MPLMVSGRAKLAKRVNRIILDRAANCNAREEHAIHATVMASVSMDIPALGHVLVSQILPKDIGRRLAVTNA